MTTSTTLTICFTSEAEASELGLIVYTTHQALANLQTSRQTTRTRQRLQANPRALQRIAAAILFIGHDYLSVGHTSHTL